jgi:hypothetical protein
MGTNTINYFSNDKTWLIDGKQVRGSWYRLYRPAYGTYLRPWDFDHHGSMMFNEGIAAYIRNILIDRAGPHVADGMFSGWQPDRGLNIRSNDKTVEVSFFYAEDIEKTFDPLGKAEMHGRVDIGGTLGFTDYKSGDKVGDPKKPNSNIWKTITARVPSNTVVPILISLKETDATGQEWGIVNKINDFLLLHLDVEKGLIYNGGSDATPESPDKNNLDIQRAGQGYIHQGITGNRVKIGYKITVR